MYLTKPSHQIITKIDGENILKNIEAAGRTCYKSEDKITEDSAIKFVKMVTKLGHHSVIEHENISVRFICDRGISHEIVRHRLCAFSQESTRFCTYKGGVEYIIPFWFHISKYELIFKNDQIIGHRIDHNNPQSIWLDSMLSSENSYIKLIDKGWTPQEARSVLPNSLKTELVVSCNIREWRHILNLRCSNKSHPQMVELMLPLLDEFHEIVPVLFDDIYEKYIGDQNK